MGGKRSKATVAAVVVTILTAAGGIAADVGATPAAAATATAGGTAYWALGAAGQALSFNSVSYGDASGYRRKAPVVGGAPARDGRGYWLVDSAGEVFAFGSAGYLGAPSDQTISSPIAGMAGNPANGGYWVVARNGTVYGEGTTTYGGAQVWGLLSPIVGMASTPDGGGYWLATAAGGVFSFGDATYQGSMGGRPLGSPIVGIAANPKGHGYWLVSAGGGIFSFATGFYGSMGGKTLPAPVTSISSSPDGNGYWLSGRAGAVYAFGDAPFLGAAQPAMGSTPTVGIISSGLAVNVPHNMMGYDVSQWQCPSYPYYAGPYPSGPHGFGVAQVSGGNIEATQPAGCYAQEAAWAGANEMAYIFMDPMPTLRANRSMSGPAGNCSATDQPCQYYNYGFNWAVYWVNYAHAQHTAPIMFWLDVEVGSWALDSASQSLNSREINGAIAGLRAAGQVPGIYSTNYQFGRITGGGVSSPGIALWMAGATGLTQAQQFCTQSGNGYSLASYGPFAGGKIAMVQWTSGSNDVDYACP